MNDQDSRFPELIQTEEELDDVLTRPSKELVEFIRRLSSPLVILGAGGKMGPSLAVLAKRAAREADKKLEVVAVSRFSSRQTRDWLDSRGVRTISADLMNRAELDSLPDAENVVSMVGLKFGTTDNPSLTWALNTLAPAHIAQRYAQARIAALSTGNVYSMSAAADGGSVEGDPTMPVGEYPNAAVARERIFEYFSTKNGTPLVLLRLNYAVDLRWGVLVDIARKLQEAQPIDVAMGYLNCIWLGDANDMIIRTLGLAAAEPTVLNLTGPGVLSVRDLAFLLGELMGRPVEIEGREEDSALLSNSARLCEMLGAPPTPLESVLRWTAHWIRGGGPLLGQPTHFDVRDGKY